MKRKLALLLAAVMVAAMVPVTAFAKTDNHVTNVVTMKAGDDTDAYKTPSIVIAEKDEMVTGTQFELVLDGAEWAFAKDASNNYGAGDIVPAEGLELLLLDSTTLSVELLDTYSKVEIALDAKVTGEEGTVTIVPNDEVITAGTYTFAKTTESDATVKNNGVVNVEIDGDEVAIKSIVISETVAGALKDGKEIKVRLYGDFEFDPATLEAVAVSTIDGLEVALDTEKSTTTELYFDVTRTGAAVKAGKVSITGIYVVEDGAKEGDIAEIVVSGAGVGKTTLEVAKAVSYGISFTAEDKKLPVFYAGRKYTDDKALKVTFKELAVDSWWSARKTTLTFPEGVKVESAEFSGEKNCDVEVKKIDGNVVTLDVLSHDTTKKAEWKAEFTLSISPDFTGEITCTVGGPAIPEDIEVVVAEAQYAVTFEVEVSDVSIDYRNTPVGDITIKEAFAGALVEDTELGFFVDKIALEGKAKAEVVEGDIEVKLTDDSELYDEFGGLLLTVEEESYKTPATIKITGVEAYLTRDLPAGSYNLEVYGDAIFKNYATKTEIKDSVTAQDPEMVGWAAFPIDHYELADAYIEVVTAGRDQDDSTFTTSVKVTIGANEMVVGQGTVALDVPAYIANGYTMLPVRAVADALSGDAATVLWDDATKTVTIAFGARIISMTIGSKVMNINGVAIPMNAAPELTNNRTFLPLRDLGYALGLTDADIAWDDTTKTATLN